jgi:hypothetical protein
MAVTFNRTGPTLTVTITTDISAIIAATGIPVAEKKHQALRQALNELTMAFQAHNRTDAEIDAQVTAASTEAERLKAARPTGNL